MKVKSLGKNITEIHRGNYVILVSYETPVAFIRPVWNDPVTRAAKTETYYSVTTSRHINQWLSGHGLDPNKVISLPQHTFDSFLNFGE